MIKMAELKTYLIEWRTDESRQRKVDDKIGIVVASSVEIAANIIGKEIKEKFPEDQDSAILQAPHDFGMLCLISLPVIDSPDSLSAELMHRKTTIDYMNRISA